MRGFDGIRKVPLSPLLNPQREATRATLSDPPSIASRIINEREKEVIIKIENAKSFSTKDTKSRFNTSFSRAKPPKYIISQERRRDPDFLIGVYDEHGNVLNTKYAIQRVEEVAMEHGVYDELIARMEDVYISKPEDFVGILSRKRERFGTAFMAGLYNGKGDVIKGREEAIGSAIIAANIIMIERARRCGPLFSDTDESPADRLRMLKNKGAAGSEHMSNIYNEQGKVVDDARKKVDATVDLKILRHKLTGDKSFCGCTII